MDRQEGEEGRLEVAAFITAVAVSLEMCSRGRVGTTCVCRRGRWGPDLSRFRYRAELLHLFKC